MAETGNKYLVLGANGQLGAELVRQLGDEAIAKPREALDITNLAQVRRIIPMLQPTLVINAAAVTELSARSADPDNAWKVNAQAVDNLVKSCARKGVPLLHISCASVFGAHDSRTKPYSDTDAVGTYSNTGQTKLAGEHGILRFGQCLCPEYWDAGFRYWVVRTGLVYERPWRQSTNLPYQLLAQSEARRKGEIALPTDVVRSFAYAPNLARSIVWMARNYREVVSGVYHVADDGFGSLYDFGRHMRLATRKMLDVAQTVRADSKQTGLPATMPANISLDCSKLDDILPYRRQSWQDALKNFVYEWERR